MGSVAWHGQDGAAADQGGFAVALGHAQKVMPKKPVAESLDDKKA